MAFVKNTDHEKTAATSEKAEKPADSLVLKAATDDIPEGQTSRRDFLKVLGFSVDGCSSSCQL